MKVVVLGANGRAGEHVVCEARDQGSIVTAVVRSDAKRPHDPARRVEVGAPSDPRFLAWVFRGHDAVISTLGGRSPTKKATSICHKSARSIVDAAWDTGLKQGAVTSSALPFPSERLINRLPAAIVCNLVKSATRIERILQTANLDVVVAGCGFLTDGEETGDRAEPVSLPNGGSSISRPGLPPSAHSLRSGVARSPSLGSRPFAG
ncbi:MAG: NAD(P)H-binding protein [Sulfitobacter sp.]|nr:NAD(P)H-binding protein [Sulfitobacter sp.]